MGIPRLSAWFVLWGTLAAIPVAADAPTSETWTPIGRAAQTTTGKVTVTAGQITFQNGTSLQLSPSTEMLFRPQKKAKKVLANLFHVIQPADPILENGNKLCGARLAIYLIVWKSEKLGAEVDPRTMVVFSGPKFDPGSPDECARYSYDAGRR